MKNKYKHTLKTQIFNLQIDLSLKNDKPERFDL